MLRHGAGAGILMGVVLTAIGGALSVLGVRHHGPGGAQAIYAAIIFIGALRVALALIPERRAAPTQPPRAVMPTGAPVASPTPAPSVNVEPLRVAAGCCWDCGNRVRDDAAICFHCGAAQVNGYQRATGKPRIGGRSYTPEYQPAAGSAR
ncbi:MAG TPA: hypothetical protein VJN88_08810 [Ktedonobacterales bacterium]|nr:hypothetical protein [Ktedonobacterales bacterium]